MYAGATNICSIQIASVGPDRASVTSSGYSAYLQFRDVPETHKESTSQVPKHVVSRMALSMYGGKEDLMIKRSRLCLLMSFSVCVKL